MRNRLDDDLETVSKSPPGPAMVILLLITSSPLVRLMICPLSEESKLIVSPSLASASAWRNEPGPLAFVLVTVMTSASTDVPRAQTSANQIRVHRPQITD